MDVLSSREWAILLWALLVIGCLYLLERKVLKKAFIALLRTLCSRHIVSAIILMTLYVVIIVYGLSSIGLWNPAQLKNTFIWYFSVAAFSMFRINHFKDAPHRIKDMVADNFRLMVVIEYLVGKFTFPFILEFLLVPLVAMLSITIAYAENKAEFQDAQKLLSRLLNVIAILIIGATLYLTAMHLDQIANREAILDLVVPVFLTTSYTPFIAFLVLYTTYQDAVVRLQFSIKKRPLELYARFLAMFVFNIRIRLLRQWATFVSRGNLQTLGDVHRSILQISRMAAREKNPPEVERSKGWSPYQAKNYLLSEGIKTSYYHPIDPMTAIDWFCCSNLMEFGSGLFPNNIGYFLNGNEHAVKSMKLQLNVNSPEHSLEAHAKLLSVANTLMTWAVGLDLNDKLSKSIIPGTEGTLKGEYFKVEFIKHPWPNHISGGYDLNVELSVI